MQTQTTVRRGEASSDMARRAGRPGSVLNIQERKVIALLRSTCARPAEGDAHGTLPSGLGAAFAALAAEIRANGLVVFAERSAFVSDDERTMLCWLAALQRPSQSAQWRMANPLQQVLKACAAELEQDGRRLPARSMLADGGIRREGCFRIELIDARSPVSEARSVSRPDAGDAQDRALAFVRLRQFATASQFRALGISPQKLRQLCRRGYVERVALGLYAMPGSSSEAGMPRR